MNEVVLAKFTPQLLRGAAHLGFDNKALSTLLRTSQTQLSQMACGLADLDARQAKKLEKATGRSVGELAILGIAADTTPTQRTRHAALIRQTLQLLSGVHALDAKPSSSRAPRAPARRRPRKRTGGTRARAA